MKHSLSEFITRWTEKIEEIKKQEFDRDQCYWISREFLNEMVLILDIKRDDLFEKTYQRINSDLTIALEIAFSNYRKNRRGFFSKIFGGKKELNLIKYK